MFNEKKVKGMKGKGIYIFHSINLTNSSFSKYPFPYPSFPSSALVATTPGNPSYLNPSSAKNSLTLAVINSSSASDLVPVDVQDDFCFVFGAAAAAAAGLRLILAAALRRERRFTVFGYWDRRCWKVWGEMVWGWRWFIVLCMIIGVLVFR